MDAWRRKETQKPYRAIPEQGESQIIVQADGSLVRTVEAGKKRKEKRPRDWKEVRLVCAQAVGKKDAVYAATFESVEYAGRQWGHCALSAGRGQKTKIHGVGDGAPWISQQCKEVYGKDGTFLLDFYHASEYLAEAGATCRPKNPKQWLKTQQRRLKRGNWKKVVKELLPNLEAPETDDKEAPVRRAHRYLSNRKDQLFYDQALKDKLPIGSGLIESGHKHVVQARMKKAGASWLIDVAEKMITARTCIANDHWNQYWGNQSNLAA